MTRTGPSVLTSVVVLIAMVSYQFYLSWVLTLITMAIVPVMAVAARTYGVKVKKLGKEAQDGLAHATALAGETLSNIRTIRALGREAASSKRFDEEISDSYTKRSHWAVLAARFNAVSGFVSGLCVALMALVGGRQVLLGVLSVGGCVVCLCG